MPSKAEEVRLIETLRTVTSGKIYVEVERARLTHRLAKIQEKDGQLEQAAKTMQELQVIFIYLDLRIPLFRQLAQNSTSSTLGCSDS